MRRLGLVVALALMCAASADAKQRVFFICGYDVCRIDPDGSGRKQLTRNGTAGQPYSLAHTRDSGRVVFGHRRKRYSANQRLGDRRSIFANGSLSTDAKRWYAFLIPPAYAVLFGKVSTGRAIDQVSLPNNSDLQATLWWKSARVYGEFGRGYRICLLDKAFACQRVVARPPGEGVIYDFDVSADGRWIVTEEDIGAEDTRLIVYRTATGKRVRTLSRGREDRTPTFSPDGRHVVFTRGRSEATGVWIVPARGGASRRLAARGGNPVWAR